MRQSITAIETSNQDGIYIMIIYSINTLAIDLFCIYWYCLWWTVGELQFVVFYTIQGNHQT